MSPRASQNPTLCASLSQPVQQQTVAIPTRTTLSGGNHVPGIAAGENRSRLYAMEHSNQEGVEGMRFPSADDNPLYILLEKKNKYIYI